MERAETCHRCDGTGMIGSVEVIGPFNRLWRKRLPDGTRVRLTTFKSIPNTNMAFVDRKCPDCESEDR